MDIREKLVELLESINAYAEENLGFDKVCGGELIDFRGAEYIADHLIANGVTVLEWVSVGERFPTEFVSVLGYMPDARPFPSVRECYYEGDGFYFPALREVYHVSHWMPLPQPPKGE